MLSSFIEKNATIQNEEVVEKLENLGIKIRDVFLDYLKEIIPIQEYNINNAQLTQRFWILEKLFAFGYHNGVVNKESIEDYCGHAPVFNDGSIEATEHFSMYSSDTEIKWIVVVMHLKVNLNLKNSN